MSIIYWDKDWIIRKRDTGSWRPHLILLQRQYFGDEEMGSKDMDRHPMPMCWEVECRDDFRE